MALSGRDIKLLWGRAAERCAFPDCRRKLSRTEDAASVQFPLGKQAHIVGEKRSSPRGNDPLSFEDREKYPNFILLCAEHHDVIDNAPLLYSVARLHQLKSEHELWVEERLSTVDRSRLASELVYASLIDSAAENLWLARWGDWTGRATAPTPMWPHELVDDVGRFWAYVTIANFTGELRELEWALKATAAAAGAAARTFEEHAVWFRDGPFLRGDQFYRLSAGSPHLSEAEAEWDRWRRRCYAWVYESTRAVNWFAEVVRRDVNPLFFAVEGKFPVFEPTPDAGRRVLKLEYSESERTEDRASVLTGSPEGCPEVPMA